MQERPNLRYVGEESRALIAELETALGERPDIDGPCAPPRRVFDPGRTPPAVPAPPDRDEPADQDELRRRRDRRGVLDGDAAEGVGTSGVFFCSTGFVGPSSDGKRGDDKCASCGRQRWEHAGMGWVNVVDVDTDPPGMQYRLDPYPARERDVDRSPLLRAAEFGGVPLDVDELDVDEIEPEE